MLCRAFRSILLAILLGLLLAQVAVAHATLIRSTPAAGATPIRDIRRRPTDRIGLLLGAEGPGLAASTLTRATQVRIPLRDGVDSLNVGHAAAIAFATLVADVRPSDDDEARPATTA